MDNTVYVLIEKVNSWRISAYQKKIEGESNIFLKEGETDKETIYNFIINLISEEKLSEILKEI